MHSRPGPSGFTLIELLVVISIIALLMAILLPTLTKAREAARITQCLSNQRQHGIAVEAYAIDNDGKYPVGFLESATSGGYTIYSWMGKPGQDPGPDTAPAEDRDLNPYLGNPKGFDVEVEVAHCPSDDDFYDYFGTSYIGNLTNSVPLKTIRTNIVPPGSIKQAVVVNPSLFVVASERGGEYFAFQGYPVDSGPISTSLFPFDESDLFWHSNEKKFNLLFGDGHASTNFIVDSILEGDGYNWEYE